MTAAVLHILLVEDSALLAERLREALAQLPNVEVVGTAESESDAIEMVRTLNVDLMILDLQLKRGTGFGVLQALGKDRPMAIVLTNYALPAYQRRAKELGVEYFLDKSRDYEKLTSVIESMRPQIRH